MCNSFKLLAEQCGQHNINILSGENDPFLYLNGQFESEKNQEYINDYKKEFYEMIINYKNYFREFNLINDEIDSIITSKSIFIKVFIYIYLTIDTSMIIFAGSLMYLYTITFESILIKIINFINMTINIKNDDFSFNSTFSKKNRKFRNNYTIL